MYRLIAIAAAVMTNTFYNQGMTKTFYDQGAMRIVKSLPRPRDHVQSQTIPYRDHFRGNFDFIKVNSGPGGGGKGASALCIQRLIVLTNYKSVGSAS